MNPLLLRRRGVIGRPSGLWTPAELDLGGWWDPSLLLSDGYADLDPVTLLADLGPNGFDFANASGSARPKVDADGIGGLPALDFTAGNVWLGGGDVLDPVDQPFSIFLVLKDGSHGTRRMIQKRGTGGFSTQDGWLLATTTSSSNYRNTGIDNGGASTTFPGGSIGIYDGNPHVLAWSCPNAASETMRLYEDGNLVTTATFASGWVADVDTDTRQLTLGCADNSLDGSSLQQFYNGRMGEIVFAWGDLHAGTDEFVAVHDYLSAKWGTV